MEETNLPSCGGLRRWPALLAAATGAVQALLKPQQPRCMLVSVLVSWQLPGAKPQR